MRSVEGLVSKGNDILQRVCKPKFQIYIDKWKKVVGIDGIRREEDNTSYGKVLQKATIVKLRAIVMSTGEMRPSVCGTSRSKSEMIDAVKGRLSWKELKDAIEKNNLYDKVTCENFIAMKMQQEKEAVNGVHADVEPAVECPDMSCTGSIDYNLQCDMCKLFICSNCMKIIGRTKDALHRASCTPGTNIGKDRMLVVLTAHPSIPILRRFRFQCPDSPVTGNKRPNSVLGSETSRYRPDSEYGKPGKKRSKR